MGTYVSKVYMLVLCSHVLPDFMVTNPSLLPIFPLDLVSSGKDYAGLDNLPETDTHACIYSFIHSVTKAQM